MFFKSLYRLIFIYTYTAGGYKDGVVRIHFSRRFERILQIISNTAVFEIRILRLQYYTHCRMFIFYILKYGARRKVGAIY